LPKFLFTIGFGVVAVLVILVPCLFSHEIAGWDEPDLGWQNWACYCVVAAAACVAAVICTYSWGEILTPRLAHILSWPIAAITATALNAFYLQNSTLTEAWIPLESLLMMIGALAGLPVYFLLRYMLATGDDNTASSQEGDVQLHYGGVPLQEEP